MTTKPSSLTVAEFLEQWLRDTVSFSVRPTTSAGYRYLCRNHLIPACGHQPLQRLTPMEIQAFLAAALRRGLAPSTVRQALRVLRIALERARSFGLVTENVARQVAPPRVPRPLIVPPLPALFPEITIVSEKLSRRGELSPRSADRGVVRPRLSPVTDIIQCWLDTSYSRIREQEQADFLWRNVLKPALSS